MASVSVYRSNAMYVLGTKTLTLPNQDGWWKSAPPTQLCNYHDNHCQQRPDWAGSGREQTRCLPVKASSEHCWGCVKITPSLPYLFCPSSLIHSPSVRAVPGLSSCTDEDCKLPKSLDTALAWSRAAPGARRNLEATFELNQTDLQLWRRNIPTKLTTTGTKSDNEREICMAVYSGKSMKV